MILLLLMLLVPAGVPVYAPNVTPAAPTVGDLITIEFPGTFAEPLALDASPAYEIVSQRGRRAVIRTFEPKPFTVSGTIGGEHFTDVRVNVRSVLKPKDNLEPAPLRPPLSIPYARGPFLAIGISALIAAFVWAAVVLVARSQRVEIAPPEIVIEPAERFRATVAALREDGAYPNRWAALADATRLYLSSLSPHLGLDLTTSQLLPRVASEHVAAVAQILRQGDFEKFSPWGAPHADFDALAARALELIPVPRVEEAAAA